MPIIFLKNNLKADVKGNDLVKAGRATKSGLEGHGLGCAIYDMLDVCCMQRKLVVVSL